MAKRRPKRPPTSALVAAGDTLVYANGEEVGVINLLWINGEPGVQLDDKSAMFLGDRFKPLREVEKWVGNGCWKVVRRPESSP